MNSYAEYRENSSFLEGKIKPTSDKGINHFMYSLTFCIYHVQSPTIKHISKKF